MRTPRIILAGLATLGLGLAAAVPPAQASVNYGPVESFGEGDLFFLPFGVAVNQKTGDVYVSKLLVGSIGVFTGSGSQISTFGGGKEGYYSGTAVNPVTGDLYVVANLFVGGVFEQELQTYNPADQLISQFSIAGSGNFIGDNLTAVQIASDSAGNVYLPNAPNNEVQEFSPAGTILATFTGSGAEALKEPTGVAVDSSGNVYVADNGNGRVEELSPSGAFVMAIGTGVNETTGGSVCTAGSGDTCGPGSDGSQSIALDGAGDIFVGENNGAGFHVVLYNPTGEKLDDFGLGTLGTKDEAINTLAVTPSGLVYVIDEGNEVVWIYAPQSKPSVQSTSAVAVNYTTATLKATIGTGNVETSYHFEYGTSTAYSASIPVPDVNLGNDLEGPVFVGQGLSGLQPGTTYHYRVVATNSLGETVGPDQTFTTLPPAPPMVSTGQAVGVAQNSATLTGTIETEGVETVYEFDLGVDTSYGTRVFGAAGVEPGTNTYMYPLQGLKPDTTYHFRIVATNTFGTAYGVDQAFTTASYPTSVLASPETPPLLPTPLLALAGNTHSTGARAVGKSSAHSARHHKARESTHESGRRGPKGRSGARGRAHGDNRGGGR